VLLGARALDPELSRALQLTEAQPVTIAQASIKLGPAKQGSRTARLQR
jgi:hypothetical protein